MPASPWRNMAWSSASSTLIGPSAFGSASRSPEANPSPFRRHPEKGSLALAPIVPQQGRGCDALAAPLVWTSALCSLAHTATRRKVTGRNAYGRWTGAMRNFLDG